MPKKKGGAEKDKKVRKKCYMNERETLFYEQQILDNNRQLARLRSRNEELEDTIEELKEKLRQLEEDRSDVVAHLKRVLQLKTEEARELNERLLALEELRKQEQIANKKKEEAMELEYHTMESNLTAELKLAAGKLNALEDWRAARLDLMNKFEVQEEEMAEQEERHKNALYHAEKALIIGKAKMKKEMEERLNELAQSFREATNIRIADATHRAIRENIALNKELDAMLNVCHDLESKTKEYKERDRMLRLQASLFENEAKMALAKTIKQNGLIDKLAEEHRNMALNYGKVCREDTWARNNEQIIQDYKNKCADIENKIRILEQHIQQTKESKEQVLKEVRGSSQEIQRLNRVLNEARRCIMEALQLQAAVQEENVCTMCYPNVKEKLLHSLLDILGRQDCPSPPESRSPSQVESVDSKYTYGNLGLVPNTRPWITMEEEVLHESCINVSEQCIMSNVSEDGKTDRTEFTNEMKIQENEKTDTVPECLLEDTESSDILSPRETESDRSDH